MANTFPVKISVCSTSLDRAHRFRRERKKRQRGGLRASHRQHTPCPSRQSFSSANSDRVNRVLGFVRGGLACSTRCRPCLRVGRGRRWYTKVSSNRYRDHREIKARYDVARMPARRGKRADTSGLEGRLYCGPRGKHRVSGLSSRGKARSASTSAIFDRTSTPYVAGRGLGRVFALFPVPPRREIILTGKGGCTSENNIVVGIKDTTASANGHAVGFTLGLVLTGLRSHPPVGLTL